MITQELALILARQVVELLSVSSTIETGNRFKSGNDESKDTNNDRKAQELSNVLLESSWLNSKLLAEVENLKKQVLLQNDEMQQLRSEVRNFKAEMSTQPAEDGEKIAIKEEKGKNAVDEMKQDHSEIKTLQSQIQENVVEAGEFAKDSLQEEEKTRVALENDIKHCRVDLRSLREDIVLMKKEKERLQSQLTELCDELTATKKSLSAEAENFKKNGEAMKRKEEMTRSSIENEIKQCRKEIVSLRTELDTQKKDNAVLIENANKLVPLQVDDINSPIDELEKAAYEPMHPETIFVACTKNLIISKCGRVAKFGCRSGGYGCALLGCKMRKGIYFAEFEAFPSPFFNFADMHFGIWPLSDEMAFPTNNFSQANYGKTIRVDVSDGALYKQRIFSSYYISGWDEIIKEKGDGSCKSITIAIMYNADYNNLQFFLDGIGSVKIIVPAEKYYYFYVSQSCGQKFKLLKFDQRK